MATKKKRRSSHAKSLRKYTPEERKAHAKKHHAPVEREHFESVMRRLLAQPPSKKRAP